MKKAVFLLAMLILTFSVFAEKDTIMTEEFIKTSQIETFRFLQYVPNSQQRKLPLIVYLHGGEGRGDDLSLVRKYLFPTQIEEGYYGNLAAYVVCPQAPSGGDWTSISQSVFELIDYMCKNYNINEQKISLMGHSMGGTGTWMIAAENPKRFSCIVPMSGSIRTNDANVNKLKNMPIWAFVGMNDDKVAPESSINFVSEIKKADPMADCEITTFEEAGHFDVPALALEDEEIGIVNWILSKEQKNEILRYNEGRVFLKNQREGEYTLVFADYQSGILQNIKAEPVTCNYGKMTVSSPIVLQKGDKIFLWDTLENMNPLAASYNVMVN